MAQQKVELRKIRDFSENLNDTFVFIRQNFKPLLISFLGIAGVFMLAAAIVSGIYQAQFGNLFEMILKGNPTATTSNNLFNIFNPTYFFLIVLSWLNIVAMKVSVVAYMKVYENKNGETPTMPEVWAEFTRYFLKVLIYSIPIVLLIIVGCVLCFLPGIYLWVILVPFEMLVMIEGRSFSDSFNRCFTIISKNFWPSFGIYIIAYLIYSFSSGIIGAVMGLIAGILSYFTTKDISSTIGIVTSILSIFSFIFYIVFCVSAILNYYSLSEKFDGTGMMRRLGNLGGGDTRDFNNLEEQY